MKILTFIMLASLSLSSFASGNDLVTKKDCKELEKAMGIALKERGFPKEQVKYGKKIIKVTCAIAVEEQMTGDEYSRELLAALQQVGF